LWQNRSQGLLKNFLSIFAPHFKNTESYARPEQEQSAGTSVAPSHAAAIATTSSSS
jgi:hypothetical protein